MVLALGSRSFFTFVEMAGPFWWEGLSSGVRVGCRVGEYVYMRAGI